MSSEFLQDDPGASAVVPAAPRRGLWGHFVYCMKNYANGKGRASRAEYWSFVLFEVLFLFAAIIIDVIVTLAVYGAQTNSHFLPIFTCLAIFGFLLPNLTVLIRRLHDVGMSGWFLLLEFVPYVGGLFALVISLIPGQAEPNKYGPGPGRTLP